MKSFITSGRCLAVVAAAGMAGIASAGGGGPCDVNPLGCQDRDTSIGGRTSNLSSFTTADDFVPFNSGDITEVCFWGMYSEDVVLTDNFRVRYYNDVEGVPTGVLAEFSQGVDLTVSAPFDTGEIAVGGGDPISVYEYKASHAAVSVSSGTCYWIEVAQIDASGAAGDNWFWKSALTFNTVAMQDGNPLDGYALQDGVIGDMAFCVSSILDDSSICIPPPPPAPPNDDCADATVISGPGLYPFDNAFAATGPAGQDTAACEFFGSTAVDNDVWFAFEATCEGLETGDPVLVTVATCDTTEIDTKIAIYDGTECEPLGSVLGCIDDFCAFQSQVSFTGTIGNSYLIQLGTFPGAAGGFGDFTVDCSPATGACCVDGSCLEMTAAACADLGGDFLGLLTECGGFYTSESGNVALDDISGTGTEITLLDDDGEVVPLGFSVEFWNSTQTEFTVSSNGHLAVGDLFGFGNTFPIPSPGVPEGVIAPAWDDLNPEEGGNIYVQSDNGGPGGIGRFIAQWSNVPIFGLGGSSTNTFQAIVYEDNQIEFRYGRVDLEAPAGVANWVVGTENLNGSAGLALDPTATVAQGNSALLIYTGDPEGMCTEDTCLCDFDGDGTVNSGDFFGFLAAFDSGDAEADVNGDGMVNSADFFDFLGCFSDPATAGC